MARGVGLRILVWAALCALLALTVALSFAPLGPFRLAVSLAIAAAKAGLIYWFYMEIRQQEGIVRLVAVATLFFLGILFLITSLDFAVRSGALVLS